MMKIRLAVVVSHPIQYFVPLYRALAAHTRIDLHVFYASRHGHAAALDRKMGVSVAWAADLTNGYAHSFLDAPGIARSVETWRGGDAPAIGRNLQRFAPDAVLVHGYAHPICLRALIWASLRKVPLLLLADGSFDAGSGKLHMALKRLVLPKLLARFAAVLSIGERGVVYLEGWGVRRKKLFRFPTSLADGFEHASAEGREILRREWGAGEADIVILAVGKLYREKRVDDLIEAVARLDHASRSRALCVIAGDGTCRREWEVFAHELYVRAVFAGFVNLDRLPAFYRAADIFVHPAEREQYGMVVLEAARAGLPLVISNRVGALAPTDVARAGHNALAFPAGDVPRLAEAIRRLIDDEPLRARMGQSSLAISAHHTPMNGADTIVRTLEKVFAS